jgi:pimeloyl-ACP methyl ester carboxylesterase
VLFLHGGPGTSQLTSNARNTRELEDAYTLVDWDQRGAGRSYAAIRDESAMNFAQFVADTHDVTRQLLQAFRQDRLVLVGHSWGSAVGAVAASEAPELYSCYVGIGQVANMAEGETLSYQWTLGQARARGNNRAVRSLEAIGPPPYNGDWQKSTLRERRYLAQFHGELYHSGMGAMGLVLSNLVLSREYGLRDRFNYFRGLYGSMRLLWPELLTVNLFDTAPNLEVPVAFMEGRHDWEVPSVLSARYFEMLSAPAKHLYWFEHSGHLPNVEERHLFNKRMRNDVALLAQGAPA